MLSLFHTNYGGCRLTLCIPSSFVTAVLLPPPSVSSFCDGCPPLSPCFPDPPRHGAVAISAVDWPSCWYGFAFVVSSRVTSRWVFPCFMVRSVCSHETCPLAAPRSVARRLLLWWWFGVCACFRWILHCSQLCPYLTFSLFLINTGFVYAFSLVLGFHSVFSALLIFCGCYPVLSFSYMLVAPSLFSAVAIRFSLFLICSWLLCCSRRCVDFLSFSYFCGD